MDFSAFDKEKLDEYAAEAKAAWGGTEAYREFQTKSKNRSETEERALGEGLMGIFAGFGEIEDGAPDSPEAQRQVMLLQEYITANYYRCTDDILAGLGAMYALGDEFTENIDKAGGTGTAGFVNRAIRIYCGK